jgi:hypothetical protein
MNIPQFLGYWKVVAKNKVEQTTNQWKLNYWSTD